MAFTRTAGTKQINDNCPHFCIGICTGTKENPCIYKHHKKCKNTVFCMDKDCKYGHSVTYTKRTIINKIYDIYEDNYLERLVEYRNSTKERCSRHMFCANPKCEYDHPLYINDREFILSIGNSSVSDEQALKKFDKKYSSFFNKPEEESFEIVEEKPKISTPKSDTLSTTQTVPSVSPMPVSFAGLFKNTNTPKISNDNSDDMADTMSGLIKDININTTKANEIREKISQLEEELAIVLSKISSGKEQIKELANKIAD